MSSLRASSLTWTRPAASSAMMRRRSGCPTAVSLASSSSVVRARTPSVLSSVRENLQVADLAVNPAQLAHRYFAIYLGFTSWARSCAGSLTEGAMATGYNIRVGDAERETIAGQLREHYADGRLTLDELNERLDQAVAAKTKADLNTVMRDLPQAAPPGSGGYGQTG